MALKSATLSINLCDTGDNHPIHYKVSSRTTKGYTTGWHLVEMLDETFDREFTFRHDMLDKFIATLQQIKTFLDDKEE